MNKHKDEIDIQCSGLRALASLLRNGNTRADVGVEGVVLSLLEMAAVENFDTCISMCVN